MLILNDVSDHNAFCHPTADKLTQILENESTSLGDRLRSRLRVLRFALSCYQSYSIIGVLEWLFKAMNK